MSCGDAARFGTHDVDEAIVLADRVLVLDEGRFAADVDLTDRLGTSERRAHPKFAATRDELLTVLGVPAA
ncbi:hypothetical protein [Streptomyces sp. NPDC059894]|uniref:hypothetical protein n=1 Tax=unclassified Streptomyces TaxID=2593676 RepID=UPI0036665806